ncbi:uncharacterized protein CYBJADRAFT_168697 [Cyberlindnera jadinii NRRL Y-1542]|uniref:Uncharacterized protein n=1 Tax=Cyberlindnera jadinii (strain ATCC 18201 / CBS 1600 / BCRC 20928 / JCM 3617 / NBRC 0987 / NRRL Y-1542) TaxID=983966 RepID=A0A1E4RYN1_CYBJN|nr:hypothetical protein CYBJADRAFT_168697 [Cyberlindnera jadinii NRRL Y-1542]ODV72393.1 hypothetical protein CYBJADRAFT_168697 [Cyberlindnera jadinii NRRL Y-1542]
MYKNCAAEASAGRAGRDFCGSHQQGTRLGWAGLGWAGLGWAGLGWAGLCGQLGRAPSRGLWAQHSSRRT